VQEALSAAAGPDAVSVPAEPAALGAAVSAAVASAPAGATHVLLACHDGAAALAQLRAALADAVPRHLAVLAPHGDAAEHAALAAPHAPQLPAKRRALLAAPTTGCDAVCEAQTSLLMFAAIMLLFSVMAMSGICCLHALEGPSRFEVGKEQHTKDN
jgi:hypothetical protein